MGHPMIASLIGLVAAALVGHRLSYLASKDKPPLYAEGFLMMSLLSWCFSLFFFVLALALLGGWRAAA